MNRLVIIGNGFDLAHGLKTSCKDFILYYLSKVWESLLPEGTYVDRLIKVFGAYDYFRENNINYSNDNAIKLFSNILKADGGVYRAKDQPYMLIDSNFFESIFTKVVHLNWADIETEYFNELIDIIEKSHAEKTKTTSRIELERSKDLKIKMLNEDINHLQEILIEYLKSQERLSLDNSIKDSKYLEYFCESLFEREGLDLITNMQTLGKTLYLNFNYTNTLSKYVQDKNVVYIHGTLSNDPVFGFGDDTSEKYKMLENEYHNEALKKIKSFKYLNNGSYIKLLNFINSGEFQVHIYGHSCGVSDRTLFKQIFESERCKSIKIFHYGEKDFEEKKYEISRHFTDKHEFLRKVVSFDKLRQMPQPIEAFSNNK